MKPLTSLWKGLIHDWKIMPWTKWYSVKVNVTNTLSVLYGILMNCVTWCNTYSFQMCLLWITLVHIQAYVSNDTYIYIYNYVCGECVCMHICLICLPDSFQCISGLVFAYTCLYIICVYALFCIFPLTHSNVTTIMLSTKFHCLSPWL